MNVNIYGLCSKENQFLSNLYMAVDDKEAAKWMLDTLMNAVVSIENVEEKIRMVSNVRTCNVVKVGSIDCIGHVMSEDFNVLIDLKDFMKEVNVDNGTSAV